MKVSEYITSPNSKFYHLTLLENKKSILKNGLETNRQKSGDGNIKGVYVSRTNNPLWLSAIAESQKGWKEGTKLLLVTIDVNRNGITWNDVAPDLHTDEACKLACKITKNITNITEKDMEDFVVGNSDTTGEPIPQQLTHFCDNNKPQYAELLRPEIVWSHVE